MNVMCALRRQRSRKSATILPLAMTAFLLAMALLPLIPAGRAFAADGDKPTFNVDIAQKPTVKIKLTPGPVLVDVTPTPTPRVIEVDDTVPDIDIDVNVEVETPVIDVVIDGVLSPTATAGGDGTVYINKHGCPVGYDAAGKSFNELAADCQDASNGIQFGLSDGGGYVQNQTTGDQIASGVQFSGIPEGAYAIVESVPSGYGVPRVFCDSTLAGEGGQGANFSEESVADGNQIFHVQLSGESFYCDWFNFPSTENGNGQPPIFIPGGSIFDIDGDDPIITLPDCVEEEGDSVIFVPEGVRFDVSSRSLVLDSDIRIEIEEPEFQLADREDGLPDDFGPYKLQLSRGVDLVELVDGFELHIPLCDDVDEAEIGGSISISKTECPVGFDAYAADVYDLALNCNDPLANIQFILSDGAQAIDQNSTNASGHTGFGGVPTGAVSIVEQVPAGYGEPIVYCITNAPDDQAPGDTEGQQVLDGNQVLMIMPEGGDINCSWYNVPSDSTDTGDGDGTISIFKGECPVGFDAYSADVYDLAFTCGVPQADVTFLLSDGASAIASSTSDASGSIGFTDVPAIPVSIVEQVPTGYGEPIVYCISNVPGDQQVGDTIQQQVWDGNQIIHLMEAGESLSCTWYNVPAGDGGIVIVHKWTCPSDPGFSDAIESQFEDAGCTRTNGIDFTLSYGIDTILTQITGGNEGATFWDNLPATDIHLTESIPGGYGEPIVYCSSQFPGTPTPLGFDTPEVIEGLIATSLEPNERLDCWWINIPTDDGEVIVVKYTCEAGYDLFGYGADPKEDCKHRTNGIEFSLEGSNGGSVSGITGDSGDKGKAIFEDVAPGAYTLEEIVPAGTEQVFVLSCTDNTNEWIQGYPLALGSQLDIQVEPGSKITCRWYNVPSQDDSGSIQITKYACVTEYFIDEADCEIYEGGASFELSSKQGNQWFDAARGTTNSAGLLTWSDLAPGVYQIDEVGGEWCYAAAEHTDADGFLIVTAGETTHVSIWNCGIAHDVKTPSKYPNTVFAPLFLVQTGIDAPIGASVLNPRQWAGVLDERLITFLTVGEQPVEVRIGAVKVVAKTETLETVDGAMQDPTTADRIAWYKDSSRLGIDGNVVLAGHLNYWGVPEGVFYHLAEVEVGDDIVITGDKGGLYYYRVTWVEQVDASSAEIDDVVGPTDENSVTLITCGGTWNAKVQEYSQRTVVRAELLAE